MSTNNLPHSATMDSVKELYKFLEAELKELQGGPTTSPWEGSVHPQAKTLQAAAVWSKGGDKGKGKE